MKTTHILQTHAWAEVRSKQGHQPVWIDEVLMLVKPAPKPFLSFGVISQADCNRLNLEKLTSVAKELNLSHVQIDPNNLVGQWAWTDRSPYNLKPVNSLLHRQNVIIDLTKDDETLLQEMKKNWRYNCQYSLKKGITVEFRDDSEAIEDFIPLFFETVDSKNFLGRSSEYYRQVWEVMRAHNAATIVITRFEGVAIVARMLFLHDGVVYTAYTGTSRRHNDLKAAYGTVWEVMRWAKLQGFTELNMWGIDLSAKEGESHYGYTTFKTGFGGEIIELAEARDLVISPVYYNAFHVANSARMMALRLKNKLV